MQLSIIQACCFQGSKPIVFSILLLFFAGTLLLGQDSPLYTNGMVHMEARNNIRFFLEDSRELIWGFDLNERRLFYFDGFEYTYLEPLQDGDLGCLENIAPNQIHEDGEGKLWLLYACGLYVYNPATNQMKALNKALQEASNRPVLHLYNMFPTRSGDLIFSGQTGIFVYSAAEKAFTFCNSNEEYSSGRSITYVAFEDRDGHFFFSNSDEIVEQSAQGKSTIRRFPYLLPLAYPPYGSFTVLANSVVFRSNVLINSIQVNNGRDFTFTRYDFRTRSFSLMSAEYPSFLWIQQYNKIILSADSLGNVYEYDAPSDRFRRLMNLYDFIPAHYPVRDVKVFKSRREQVLWVMTSTATFRITPSPLQFSIVPFPRPESYRASPVVSMDGIFLYQGNVYFKRPPRLMPVRNTAAPPVEIRSPALDWERVGKIEFIEAPGYGLQGFWAYFEPNERKYRTDQFAFYFWGKGLDQTETYRVSPVPPKSPGDYQGGIYTGINTADRQGQVFIPSWQGLIHRISFTDQAISMFDVRAKGVESAGLDQLMVDNQGLLWAGFRSSGVEVYSRDRKVRAYTYKKHGAKAGLSSNYVTFIYEDQSCRKWVGTTRGLNLINPGDSLIRKYYASDGLIDNTVRGVIEDHKGRIWVFTPGAVAFLPPGADKFYGFRVRQGDFFSERIRPLIDQQGYIYTICRKGVFVFHPDSIKIDQAVPSPFLKYLLIRENNTKIPAINHSGNKAEELLVLKLKHHESSLTFGFGASEFFSPQEIRFAYFLEGYDKKWQFSGPSREAAYTQLPPGTYCFMVKCANEFGTWGQETTEARIRILPPWYWSPWSKLGYFLAILGLLAGIRRYELQRRDAKNKVQELQEQYDFKSRFSNNITHDFRTPLTVILGMADQVEQKPDVWFREGLELIRHNGRKVLHLVNQILDLGKLDQGMLPVKLVQADLVAFLRLQAEMVASFAESQDKTLELRLGQAPVMLDFDPEKVRTVVDNLLSNAIKFTRPGDRIVLSLDKEDDAHVVITVADSGPGIAPEQLPHIFDRYYQGEEAQKKETVGSGIGLALVRELTELLGGRVEVQSTAGAGTTFAVRLPVSRTAPLADPAELAGSGFAPETAASYGSGLIPGYTEDLPQLLIVEDNADLVKYLQACLDGRYALRIAFNGREGLDMALKHMPDIVLSDVMMPEVGGFELCRTLKEDPRTSHIPVILLTALADKASRLEGLKGGADAYLVKPFDEDELEISLTKALELRLRLREYYKQGMPPECPDTPLEQPAKHMATFIHTLDAFLEQHYACKTLSVPDMAASVFWSVQHFRRMLQVGAGMTPQQYLLHFRLEKSRAMLADTGFSLSQIAQECAFSDSAHYSNAFKRAYGVSPSEYRKGRE